VEILIFLIPLLTGLAACLLIATTLSRPWLFLWMAPGVGIGAASVLFFLWSLAFFPAYRPGLYLALETTVLAGMAFALWKRRSRLDVRLPRVQLGPAGWLLGAAFAAAAFFFLYRFLLQTAENPLGGWDAWALWNSRARYFLFGDPSTWRNVFTVHVNQSDYPFLLSGFIARCWVLLGDDRTFVPIVTAGLFTVAVVGLLTAAVAYFRGLHSGLLAGFLLVSLPVFQWTSASQYADLPMAFYTLGAAVFLCLFFLGGEQGVSMALAGLFTGLALWTKNEGASLFLSVTAALILSGLLRKQTWLATGRMGLAFFAGILPALALYAGFKALLVPATDLFEDRQLPAMLALLTDFSRYQTITTEVLRLAITWGGWKVPFLPTLAVGALLIGFDRPGPHERAARFVLSCILALTMLQYLAIYLITPHDITWHMSTSVGRLYNQLLPAFLLLLFLQIRSLQPERTP
jgi:hypothetical protein